MKEQIPRLLATFVDPFTRYAPTSEVEMSCLLGLLHQMRRIDWSKVPLLTIDSAVSAITYWDSQDLKDFRMVKALAPTETLFPLKADSAMDHAGRISPEGASKLSAAFDDLRAACAEIENLRKLAEVGLNSVLEPVAQKAHGLLRTALAKFTEAKAVLLKAGA